MVLTEKALSEINVPAIRLKLALALGFSETWVRSLIQKNKSNGDLTTAAALRVIKEETGLSEEDILCESVVEAQK